MEKLFLRVNKCIHLCEELTYVSTYECEQTASAIDLSTKTRTLKVRPSYIVSGHFKPLLELMLVRFFVIDS